MTPVEKAQMWHLRASWEQYADELLLDERTLGGWYIVDLLDLALESVYRPDGRRRSLDA